MSIARGPSCRRARCRRSSCGSTPAACRSAIWSSPARRETIAEIQDLALFKVRPMFASLPGVSAPPPFGGSRARSSFALDPERLRSYSMSPDEVVAALTAGNTISPSGNMPIGDKYADRADELAGRRRSSELGNIPIRTGERRPSICATSARSRTPPTSRPAMRWSTAAARFTSWSPSGPTPRRSRRQRRQSATCRKIQAVLPDDIKVSFEFDQSPYVTRAIAGLVDRRAARRAADRPDGAAVPARLAERRSSSC